MVIHQLRTVLLGGCALALFGAADAATAQTAVTAPAAEETVPDEAAPDRPQAEADIVVTGSRLSAAGFTAPTPVTALDAGQLTQRSPNNIADALNKLPQLKGSAVAGQTFTPSVGEGTNGQNLLNLRNLGPFRTLILLDGNRLPVTNNAGSTDINIIPQALVRRVDIVTGGASASYGSDAVAGVVNFVLDTRFEGVKIDVNAGLTSYGDNGSQRATIAVGKSLADGRGRIIASADYFRADAIGYSNRTNGRDWFDNPEGAYNNVSGGRPRIIVVPQVRHSEASTGGLITSGPLRGFQFGPGGSVIPFNGGTTPTLRATSGGDGPRMTAQLSPEQERGGAFLHGEYDVADAATLYVQGGYFTSRTRSDSYPTYQYRATGQFTVFRDNAFAPATIQQMFAANPGLASFTVGRISEDLTPNIVTTETTMTRISGGVRGNISDTWSYDANALYSRVLQELNREQTINRNLYAAADAVVNPATGQIVCRSTLQGLDPGCAPLNIFGPGAPSRPANDYVIGVNTTNTTFEQAAFNMNVRGNLGDTFNLGAGPILVAVGAAYRTEPVRRTVDALSNIVVNCTGVRGCPAAMNTGNFYGGYLSGNAGPISGRISAKEAYAEFGVPLLKDNAVARSLNLTVAGRATDYDLSGLAYTWKAGLNWEVNDDLRLRVTRSRDIRAPNTTELFGSGATSTILSVLPGSPQVFPGASYTVATRVVEGLGNPNLDPEKGDTLTFGAVLRPRWAPGFQLSLDYYDVRITEAIASPAFVDVIDGCFAGNAVFCGMITLNGAAVTSTTQIPRDAIGLQLRVTPENIARQSTSGLDLEVAYTRPLGAGSLDLRLYGNYLLTAENSSIPGSKLVGTLGQGSPWPRWSGSLSAEYRSDRFGLFVEERLISKGFRNAALVEGVDITTNRVPMVAYTDVTATYRFGEGPFGGSQSELYVNVANLFDRAPPSTVTAVSNTVSLTNYALYDVIGRRFTVGARFRW